LCRLSDSGREEGVEGCVEGLPRSDTHTSFQRSFVPFLKLFSFDKVPLDILFKLSEQRRRRTFIFEPYPSPLFLLSFPAHFSETFFRQKNNH
jgi:hypothetical protein